MCTLNTSGSCHKPNTIPRDIVNILSAMYIAGAVYSSPTLDVDGTIFVGADDFNLYGISSTGTILWTVPTSGKIGYSSVAINADGNVLVGSSDGNLYSIGPGNFSSNVCPVNTVLSNFTSTSIRLSCSRNCPLGTGTQVL